jgi:hypothetical protein
MPVVISGRVYGASQPWPYHLGLPVRRLVVLLENVEQVAFRRILHGQETALTIPLATAFTSEGTREAARGRSRRNRGLREPRVASMRGPHSRGYRPRAPRTRPSPDGSHLADPGGVRGGLAASLESRSCGPARRPAHAGIGRRAGHRPAYRHGDGFAFFVSSPQQRFRCTPRRCLHATFLIHFLDAPLGGSIDQEFPDRPPVL